MTTKAQPKILLSTSKCISLQHIAGQQINGHVHAQVSGLNRRMSISVKSTRAPTKNGRVNYAAHCFTQKARLLQGLRCKSNPAKPVIARPLWQLTPTCNGKATSLRMPVMQHKPAQKPACRHTDYSDIAGMEIRLRSLAGWPALSLGRLPSAWAITSSWRSQAGSGWR